MAKIVGYILSLIGLIIIIFSNKISGLNFLAQLGSKAIAYSVIIGIAFVAAGVVFLMGNNNSSKQAEQVPIYEGEGKKRVIVGYQKLKKK